MQINRYTLAILIVGFAITTSCFKDVEIDIDENESLIVLNGWLKDKETPAVQLYASKFIFAGGRDELITNANVELFVDDEFATILTFNDSTAQYTADILIEAQRTYTIRVEHPKYPVAEASVEIPAVPTKEDVAINLRTVAQVGLYVGSSNSNVSEIDLSINDDGSKENFYLVDIVSNSAYYSEGNATDTMYYEYAYGFNSDDPIVEYMYTTSNSYLGFRDELFNGKTYSTTLKSYNDLRVIEYKNESDYQRSSNAVRLQNVSGALYKYLISLDNNQYPEPFTEPSQVFSNVKGGYGILGGSSTMQFEITEVNGDYSN